MFHDSQLKQRRRCKSARVNNNNNLQPLLLFLGSFLFLLCCSNGNSNSNSNSKLHAHAFQHYPQIALRSSFPIHTTASTATIRRSGGRGYLNLGNTNSNSNTNFLKTKQSSSTTSLSMTMEPQTLAIPIIGIVTILSAVIYTSGSEQRAQQKKYNEWEQQDRIDRQERESKASIPYRDYWTEQDLKPYNGEAIDEHGEMSGPILIGVNGDVYNVWKGRHFYGPGAEYHLFAGRDATRLLAKQKLEEETEEEKAVPLGIAEKATLQGWVYTIKSKYEVVGKMEGFDESTTAF